MFEPDRLKHLLDEPLAKARLKEEHAPFSLESLIAWLEKQDGALEYNFCDGEKCLWADYTFAHGGTYCLVWLNYQIGGYSMSSLLPINSWQARIANGAYGHGSSRGDIYSAALQRARAYQAQAASERLS